MKASVPSVLLALVGLSVAAGHKSKLRDCVRPWQSPINSVATLWAPARPLECDPDGPPCPSGRNSGCQFSLKTFKYICCQDKSDVEPPVCPKYYDSIMMTCDDRSDGSCPRGFNCLPSRYDATIRLCCRPNDDLEYPEPETTFKDNHIVPQILPFSPKLAMEVTFSNVTLALGQLLDVNRLDTLLTAPSIGDLFIDPTRLYTLVLFDSTSKSVTWFVTDILVDQQRLLLHNRIPLVDYRAPKEEDTPEGVHVMVMVLFDQYKSWTDEALTSIAKSQVSLLTILKENEEFMNPQARAGFFYGYSTFEDDRY